jgi:hypothetical protein
MTAGRTKVESKDRVSPKLELIAVTVCMCLTEGTDWFVVTENLISETQFDSFFKEVFIVIVAKNIV